MALKTYTLWRTATLRQFKEARAPEGLSDREIIDLSWTIPWKDAKVINSEGIEVE